MSDENCAQQQLFPVGPQAFCETPNITSMSLPQNVVGPQRRNACQNKMGTTTPTPSMVSIQIVQGSQLLIFCTPLFRREAFDRGPALRRPPRPYLGRRPEHQTWESLWPFRGRKKPPYGLWGFGGWAWLVVFIRVDIIIYIPSEYIHWPWYKMFSNSKDRNTVVHASDHCPRLQEQVHLAELWVQSSTPSFSWRGCASVGNDAPTRRAASTIPQTQWQSTLPSEFTSWNSGMIRSILNVSSPSNMWPGNQEKQAFLFQQNHTDPT